MRHKNNRYHEVCCFLKFAIHLLVNVYKSDYERAGTRVGPDQLGLLTSDRGPDFTKVSFRIRARVISGSFISFYVDPR